MAPKAKTAVLSFKQITVPFFVRRGLDQSRVDYFVNLYRSGGDVEPILVNRKGELIEGRHRLKAQEVLKRNKVTCMVTDITDRAKMIELAMQANSGGAKPMSEEDYIYSATHLLELNRPYRQVVKSLIGMGLPDQYARRLVSNARANIGKAKMRAAAEDVVDRDVPIAEAAKKHGVEVTSLRSSLRSRGRAATKTDRPATINSLLSKRFKALSSSNGRLLQGLFRSYEDGDVSEKTIKAALTKMKELHVKLGVVIDDHENRFAKLSGRRMRRSA